MEVIGENCCWHIRHYNESFETPMHYEHIGSTFNATYTEEEHLQNQQTELEKDPGYSNTNEDIFHAFIVIIQFTSTFKS